MNKFRKNPYPEYESCEEAWEDLLRETSRPNFQELRDFANEKLREYRGREITNDSKSILADITYLTMLSSVSNLSDLECYSAYLTTWTPLTSELPPPCLMTRFKEITEPFEFRHFIPSKRMASIREKGFFGRATPKKMTLTREVEDFYIKDNGYIFAYFHEETDAVVNYNAALVGVADRGLRFYFKPDGERQIIIPLKCIKEFRFEEYGDAFNTEDDELASNVLPKPYLREWGGVAMCTKCGDTFRLDKEAVSRGEGLFCERCRDPKK